MFIKSITVTDPDTQAEVCLNVYKDRKSGAVYAIDESFLLYAETAIIPPKDVNRGKQIFAKRCATRLQVN